MLTNSNSMIINQSACWNLVVTLRCKSIFLIESWYCRWFRFICEPNTNTLPLNKHLTNYTQICNLSTPRHLGPCLGAKNWIPSISVPAGTSIKHKIMSYIAQLFDLIGIVDLTILIAKLFMQRLCLTKTNQNSRNVKGKARKRNKRVLLIV